VSAKAADKIQQFLADFNQKANGTQKKGRKGEEIEAKVGKDEVEIKHEKDLLGAQKGKRVVKVQKTSEPQSRSNSSGKLMRKRVKFSLGSNSILVFDKKKIISRSSLRSSLSPNRSILKGAELPKKSSPQTKKRSLS